MSLLALLSKASVLWLIVLDVIAASAGPQHASKPNFVFIIADDQDLHLASLDYMPLVQKHMGRGGTFYQRHFCTIALCCPSRVSLLTGRLAHNTNVTDVSPPYGGYPKFVSQGLNDKYLPVWLQAEGFNTYYTGKLMNSHSITNWNNPFPGGWTAHDFLVDPGTYQYWNASFQKNQDPPAFTPGQYSTDQVREKALGLLDEASNGDKPFFLGVAPIAPHSEYTPGQLFTQPQPAPRHKDLFPTARAPRSSNYNPEDSSGASWIKNLPRLNSTELDYFDEFYRARLQALQALDELIDALITRLEQSNLLSNTYIIYTSDNGYHIGQHRLQPGKTCAIEEDINVPFYIRGPGVPQGEVVDVVTSHTDIVPTIFEIAGIEQRSEFDGRPMPVPGKVEVKDEDYDHVSVEYWGEGMAEGIFGQPPTASGYANNTYKALRVIGSGYNLFYSVWCTNEHELYEMNSDPGQMTNLAVPTSSNKSTQLFSRPLTQLQNRLDALLLVLKGCKASSCTDPWSVIHPSGGVKNLRDALDAKYDDFYKSQPKVSFSKCEDGYIVESEGPQEVNAYQWPYGT